MNPYIKPEVQYYLTRYATYHVHISKKEYESLTMNSYERIALYPIMTNECFIHCCKTILSNFSPPSSHPLTYEAIATQIIFPLLVERLEREDRGCKLLMEKLGR
jgi:hypothetical protein